METARARPKKLCVVVPALDEAATIGEVVRRVPRSLEDLGIGTVEVVVIDDGSTDATADLARAAGADVVVRHPVTRGLGAVFRTAVREALGRGTDYLVSIDGDLQFSPEDIPCLLAPVVAGHAGSSTASRFADPSLSPRIGVARQLGNRALSVLVSALCGRKIADVACGFRAYSRAALERLGLKSDFTYTQEALLDLTFAGIEVVEVPVRVRGTREHGRSRVAASLARYAVRSAGIIVLTLARRYPSRVAAAVSAAAASVAAVVALYAP